MKTKVNRITNLANINVGKKKFLLDHFEKVKNIKNKISEDIFKHIQKNSINSDLYSFQLSSYLKSIQQSELTANEIQKVSKSITAFYSNYIDKIKKNNKFKIQDKVLVKKYKRNTKFNKIGDIKSFEIKHKNTLISNLLNYIKYIDINLISNKEFNFNIQINNLQNELDILKSIETPTDKEIKSSLKLEKELIIKNSLNNQLNSIYNNQKLFNSMIRLLTNFKIKIEKQFKLIEFSTGSYIKVPIFNKNSIKPSKHSYVFKDDTNSLYKYWYKFKTPTIEVYIPLAYNENYHNSFNNYLLEKESYVSLSPKNKLNINLNIIVQEAVFIENNRKFVGIDLNVRDNFCTISNGKEVNEFDYNRTYINKFVNELQKVDKLSRTDKTLVINKNKLEKLVRTNQWYFKKLIGEILNHLKDEGYTDIVMEDLDLSKSSASYVKSKEFQVKYSRLVRILRLGSIKEWMKVQGEKLGLRVHLTNPAYTSQECRKCHYIDKINRNGDTFKCKECSHTEHSDYNSSYNILSRVKTDVLSNALHNYDEYQRIVPKIMKHKKIKEILNSYYLVIPD